jgi:hypothetical protein
LDLTATKSSPERADETEKSKEENAMKDMQSIEKYQQSEADKWAKKDQDIRLQVCFKKAIDVEIHLIKGAQALSEAEITARI